MAVVRPRAEIDLPFIPNRMSWGVNDDLLLVVEVGGTSPVLAVSIADESVQDDWWTDPDGVAGATITAFTVSHGACAVAEAASQPHYLDDTKLFHRLRAAALSDGQQFWRWNFADANDLAFVELTDMALMARSASGFHLFDFESESGPAWSMSTAPDRPWCTAPDLLVVASPLTMVDLDPFRERALHFWLDDNPVRLVPAGQGVVVAMGGHGPISVTAFDAQQIRGSHRLDEPGTGAARNHDLAVSPQAHAVAYASSTQLVVLNVPDMTPSAGFIPLGFGPNATPRRRQVRFSPDATMIAVNATRSGPGLTLVDAATGAGLWERSGEVELLEFSPSGELLAVCEGRRLSCYNVREATATAWAPTTDQWEVPGTAHRIAVAHLDLEGVNDPWRWLAAAGRHTNGGGLAYVGEIGHGWRYKSKNSGGLAGVTVSPKGSHFAIWPGTTEDRRNELDIRTTHNLKVWAQPGNSPTLAAAFLTEDKVVDIRGDKWVRIYEPQRKPGLETPAARRSTRRPTRTCGVSRRRPIPLDDRCRREPSLLALR